MYSLVVLLARSTCATFVGAFALERGRRWTVGFAARADRAALHAQLGAVPRRRPRGRRGPALVDAADARSGARGCSRPAIVAVLYAPWLPTLLFQTAHTGAPWANAARLPGPLRGAARTCSASPASTCCCSARRRGLATLAAWRAPPARARRIAARRRRRRRLARAVAAVAGSTRRGRCATARSRVAPLLLLAALGLARAGRARPRRPRAGRAAVGRPQDPPSTKCNVRSVTEAIAPSLAPGRPRSSPPSPSRCPSCTTTSTGSRTCAGRRCPARWPTSG